MWTAIREGGSTTFIDEEGSETVISTFDAYLVWTQVLGDTSIVFKECYTDIDHLFYVFWLFANHYESWRVYMINLLPNILAYALFFNSWSTTIEELDALGETLQLYYVYAVIVRKLFLYDYLPDELNDDLEPIEILTI